MAEIDAESLGFELLPADEDPVEPDLDLAAAEASVLEDAPPEAGGPAAPLAIGMTWKFDWEAGEFMRRGGAPVEVHGADAVIEWCYMALASARYAHNVFSEDFGMDEPEDPIGETWNAERMADYRDRFVEALLVHDRIAAVTNFEAWFDPTEGVLNITGFDVVLDDDAIVSLGPVGLIVEGEL